MNKRILAALTTSVLAASTALQAMPAYAESDYKNVRIMMNVPYSVFYNPAVYGTAQKPVMAAYGANNTSVFDALTTASPKAMDEDMFPAIYHESEGVISGVTVPVEVVAKDGGYYLDDGSRVTGQKRETVEELRNGSDYDYCVSSGVSSGYVKIGIYSDELIWQGPRSGDSISEFCETYGDRGYFVGQYTLAHPCEITASMEDGLDSEYKDVTIHIDSHGDDLGTVYGAVLVADKCGDRGINVSTKERYALRHLDEIWTSTEYGFDLEGEFAALAGKDIVQIFIYSSTGIHYIPLELDSDLGHGYGGIGLHVRKKTPAFEISTWAPGLKNWSDFSSGKVSIELNGLPDDIGGFDNNKSTVYYLDEQGCKVVIAETGDSNNNEGSTNYVYVSTDKIQNGQTYYVDWESDKYASATSSNGLRFYNPMLDDEDDRKQEESGGTDQGSTGGETSGDSGSGSTDTGKTEDGSSGSGSDIDTGKSDVNTDDVAGKTDSEDATANDDADNAGGSDEEETSHKDRDEDEDRHGTKYLSWVTVNAGTATTDGYMEYVCSECGKVKYRVPISAYYNFNKESESSIKNAAQGATVKVDTKLFVSFHKSIVDELKARPDVTLVVDYTYQGVNYEMTIPAGSGALMEQLFGQDQFAGFRYLAGAFATVER